MCDIIVIKQRENGALYSSVENLIISTFRAPRTYVYYMYVHTYTTENTTTTRR